MSPHHDTFTCISSRVLSYQILEHHRYRESYPRTNACDPTMTLRCFNCSKCQLTPFPILTTKRKARSIAQANANELVPTDTSFPSHIELINHSLQLLLLQPLTQLSRNPSQILQIYPSFRLLIEQVKRPHDLLSRIPLEDSLRGDCDKCSMGEEETRGAREGGLLLLRRLRCVCE